ncbi:MAG: hypothetical protein HC831_32350 [Chloroflexia bacterium]|nr:hypothetical protein [Bacteroidales bacterium]NJO93131.1 hypothetical protein [Chloroflexia bacterium]
MKTIKQTLLIGAFLILAVHCKEEDCGCTGEPFDQMKSKEVFLRNDSEIPVVVT